MQGQIVLIILRVYAEKDPQNRLKIMNFTGRPAFAA
jgi:hypothetical protein